MKRSKILANLFLVVLIVFSISNLSEQQAFLFLTDVAQKNVAFLTLVTEIKMVVEGLSSIHIPFIKGQVGTVGNDLGKVQNYLLFTDTIAFLQILLVSISKSSIFKFFLIALFILQFFDKKSKFFLKLLLIALAVSPGLSLYTMGVDQLSRASAIDFGNKYLKELENISQEIKKENVQLLHQHHEHLTQISNEKKDFIHFKKLKEDVAYDLKKVGNDIKGDFSKIRLLLKSTGVSIIVKVTRFCSMIFFSLFLLPIGYSFLVYLLYRSLFDKKIVFKRFIEP